MADLLVKDEAHDVTLRVKDKTFKAHRVLLKSRSPVFRNMFEHDTAERKSGEVEITDCDADAFADFLSYLYSGAASVTSRNVADLYQISDKYDVLALSEHCIDFMARNFAVESFCDYVSFAFLHNEETILKSGIHFMAENFEEILDSDEWKAFNASSPIQCMEIIRRVFRKIRNMYEAVLETISEEY